MTTHTLDLTHPLLFHSLLKQELHYHHEDCRPSRLASYHASGAGIEAPPWSELLRALSPLSNASFLILHFFTHRARKHQKHRKEVHAEVPEISPR